VLIETEAGGMGMGNYMGMGGMGMGGMGEFATIAARTNHPIGTEWKLTSQETKGWEWEIWVWAWAATRTR
jgi:hypothetical protein